MFDFRDDIAEFLEDVIYGPSKLNEIEKMRNDRDNPFGTYQYGAGILYPQQNDDLLDQWDIESENDEPAEIDELVDNSPKRSKSTTERDDDEIYRADQFFPSAFGFSCICRKQELNNLKFSVRFSWYEACTEERTENSVIKKLKIWNRKTREVTLLLPEMKKDDKIYCKTLHQDDDGRELGIQVRNRKNVYDNSALYITISLVNKATAKNNSQIKQKAFSQIALCVEGVTFLPLPGPLIDKSSNMDEKTNAFLYREIKEYAVGHGSAVKTFEQENSKSCTKIALDFLPVSEVPPADTIGEVGSSLIFYMRLLADEECFDSEIDKLEKLADKYECWISNKLSVLINSSELTDIEKETAANHEKLCKEVLERFRTGIQMLKDNEDVASVFRWTNLAMYEQQIRGKIDPWEGADRDPRSGIDEKLQKSWRPFQIAFITSLLPDMVDPINSKYRDFVDLIWFPTGGGKTEAYLGLAAFTILWRRYNAMGDYGNGTAVLMRYTLRLLASQQTARALSLVSALEIIRRENISLLGKTPITLGFFAGDGASHNTRSNAINDLKEDGEHKFILEKCPHCGRKIVKHHANNFSGAKVGTVHQNGKKTVIQFSRNTVVLYCPNTLCSFHGGIPFFPIDEDIYEQPPAFIIGTVDKLAMLPYKPEMRAIFGDNGTRKPPELILQDELHLISGALGSIAGAYEILIEKLCMNETVKPKIVSATATVARVAEQCKDLWGREMRVFPAPGPIAGHNFFSKPELDPSKMRRYLGVMLPGLSSIASQSVVTAALLAAPRQFVRDGGNCCEVDPWWTLIAYFITLRELGNFSTIEQNEIRTLLIKFYKMRASPESSQLRGPNTYKSVELTSRFSLSLVKAWMDELVSTVRVNKFQKDNTIYLKSEDVVDICRASNMIQVGLDIGRLGLMLMYRQPQTTAEYIQASSRVGRQKPGLVVILYKPQSSRDRSHYEHFHYYHSSFYRDVESISLTPWSPQVIERTVHALLIGLYRIKNPGQIYPQNIEPLNNFKLSECKKELIEAFANRGWGKDAVIRAESYIDSLLNDWANAGPLHRWSPNPYQNDKGNPWLMTPPGEMEAIPSLKRWAVMQSMRNIDSSTKLIK